MESRIPALSAHGFPLMPEKGRAICPFRTRSEIQIAHSPTFWTDFPRIRAIQGFLRKRRPLAPLSSPVLPFFPVRQTARWQSAQTSDRQGAPVLPAVSAPAAVSMPEPNAPVPCSEMRERSDRPLARSKTSRKVRLFALSLQNVEKSTIVRPVAPKCHGKRDSGRAFRPTRGAALAKCQVRLSRATFRENEIVLSARFWSEGPRNRTFRVILERPAMIPGFRVGSRLPAHAPALLCPGYPRDGLAHADGRALERRSPMRTDGFVHADASIERGFLARVEMRASGSRDYAVVGFQKDQSWPTADRARHPHA